jgi:hypothetical protein
VVSYSCKVSGKQLTYEFDEGILTCKEGVLLTPLRADLRAQVPVVSYGRIFNRQSLYAVCALLIAVGLFGFFGYLELTDRELSLDKVVPPLAFACIGVWQAWQNGIWHIGTRLKFNTGDELILFDDGNEGFRSMDRAVRSLLSAPQPATGS